MLTWTLPLSFPFTSLSLFGKFTRGIGGWGGHRVGVNREKKCTPARKSKTVCCQLKKSNKEKVGQ